MEWISVIDKRPDDSLDDILMVVDGKRITGRIFPENYIKDPFHFTMDSNGHWRNEATHWMPLPELPK